MGSCIENLFGKKTSANNESLIQSIELTVTHETTNNKCFSIYAGIKKIESFLDDIAQKRRKPEDYFPFIHDEISHLKEYLNNFQQIAENLQKNRQKIKKYCQNGLIKEEDVCLVNLELQSIITFQKVQNVVISSKNVKANYQVKSSVKANSKQKLLKEDIYEVREIIVEKNQSIAIEITQKAIATILVEDLARQLIIADILTLRDGHGVFGYITMRAQTFQVQYKGKLNLIRKVHEELKKQLEFCLQGQIGWDKLSSYRNESQERSSYISHQQFPYHI